MNKILVLLVVAMLVACAAQEETAGNDREQAVRDFIATRQLSEVDMVRTRSRDHWTELDPTFLVYKTSSGAFLIDFGRPCRALIDDDVVPDVRRMGETIRPRSDTIRGCLIYRIYALADHEVIELAAIGESPGSRN